MIKHIFAISATALAIGLVPVAAAQAASAGSTPRPLPSPCRTFSARSADRVLGLSRRVHPRERQSTTSNSRACVATHGSRKLAVLVSWHSPGSLGSGWRCYRESRLGPVGRACVSTTRSHGSVLVFRKHGLYVIDAVNITLGHRARRLVQFGLPQYKALRA
jgi:hypothetical protein